MRWLRLLAAVLVAVLGAASGCDILGATGCPHEPETELKIDNLDEYCDMYKQHLECVNDKYKGCDKSKKYAAAMGSIVKGLYRKIYKIQKTCEIEFGIAGVPVEEVSNSTDTTSTRKPKKKKKQKTTVRTTTMTTTHLITSTTEASTTTADTCELNSIQTDCHPLFTNIQFVASWSKPAKQQWCSSATAYYNCIRVRMFDCQEKPKYAESLDYYEKVKSYVLTQASLNCAGGIEGCIVNTDDVRCKMATRVGSFSESAAPATVSHIWCWAFVNFFIFKLILS